MTSRPSAGGALAAIALAVALSAAAADSPPETVTLAQALELLESQNPDSRAAALDVADAEAERIAARLYANPTLAVDAFNLPVGRTNPPGLSASQAIGATARLDQPLSLWGKRRLRMESADAGVSAARQRQRDAMRELRAALKQAFAEALYDRRLLDFAAENQKRYQTVVDLNERRFRSGDLSEAELRKIELESLKYLSETEGARRSLAESTARLGRLVGAGRAVTAAGELAAAEVPLDRAEIRQTAMRRRPDLAALERERDRAELELRLARRERLPDVTVGADYTSSQFQIGGNLRNSVGFGFSVPLPIFNRNQAEVAKAEVALRRAENELARLRLDVEEEVSDAVTAYETAQRLRRTFESGYLERAELARHAAEASYRSGGASLIELLEAERTYAATQTEHLESIFRCRAALIEVEKATGGDLTDDAAAAPAAPRR